MAFKKGFLEYRAEVQILNISNLLIVLVIINLNAKLTLTSSEFEISGKNGVKTYKMATYEWHGYQHPLTNKLTKDGNGTTYSFLEDWNTSPKADGHLHQRSVFYLNPS